MIVLYGHLSFCLRSIKVVSAELALGRRCDEFIISLYRHVQCFLTRVVTALCLYASVMWKLSYRLISRDKVGSVSNHSETCLYHEEYQTSSRCIALEKIVKTYIKCLVFLKKVIVFITHYYTTLTVPWQWIIIDHVYQDYSY